MADSLNMEMLNASLNRAVQCIRAGGIVGFPTETYYGLAVDPESPAAVANLFKVKKRQGDKPLLLLIDNREQLSEIATSIPVEFLPLMDKYWPGALTLLFPAQKCFQHLTGKFGTIGVRISSHPVAAELVKRVGKPITATSANISGLPPASTAVEVLAMFGSDLGCIIDGGKTPAGLCSTVLGLKGGRYFVVRRGQIDLSAELSVLNDQSHIRLSE